MRKKILIFLLIVAGLIAFRFFSSFISMMQSGAKMANRGAPTVTARVVKPQNIVRSYEASARVVAQYRVDILARISGYLTKSYFQEGDYVKAGQVLFEIEPQEYDYAAGKAKASLDNANSMYNYYQKQLARYEELVKNDYVAKSEYDNILAQRNAYKAQVDNAKSAYNDAQRNVGYTHVKSPVDGRVGLISVTVGNYVGPTSGPLTTINSSNPMYITFPLEAKIFSELKRIDGPNANRKVDFYFSSGQKYSIQGIQDFHDNEIDTSTGTILMRATFDNPKDELIQGDFGRIKIYSNNKDEVPVVPQTATMENQEGLYVFVLDKDNVAKLTYIKTMGQTENKEWIVIDGLNVGDMIVEKGLQKVIPGKEVNVVEESQYKDDSQNNKKKTNFISKIINKIKRFIKK